MDSLVFYFRGFWYGLMVTEENVVWFSVKLVCVGFSSLIRIPSHMSRRLRWVCSPVEVFGPGAEDNMTTVSSASMLTSVSSVIDISEV